MALVLPQGERDVALSWDINNGLPELVENLTTVRIPGATHWPFQTHPDEFHAVLDAYLG